MKYLASLLRVLRSALDGRSRQERLALAVMAAVIVAALWAQLLWSAHHERDRYRQLVADLQVRNNAMRQTRVAMQNAKSQGATVRPLIAEQALTALANELRSAGISAVTVLPDAEGQVRLVGTAGFDIWLAWVAKVHAEHGVRVVRAGMEPSGEPGMVKIEAVMALGKAK